jgi:hypothetical protein
MSATQRKIILFCRCTEASFEIGGLQKDRFDTTTPSQLAIKRYIEISVACPTAL